MIGFAANAWEVFSLFGVFLIGLLAVIWISKWLDMPQHYGLCLYVWHSLFCFVYIVYSLSNPADSIKYYLDSLQWVGGPMLGSRSVISFNSILTQVFGLSYAGCFFVYNIFGTIGLIAFTTALRDMVKEKSQGVRRLAFIVPILPGFSFWSTAIGKDSLAFFGVGLICWAVASPYRRFFAILLGLTAIVAVRPHIAALLVIALAFAFLLEGKGSLLLKLLVNIIIIPAGIALLVVAVSYVGLDEGLSSDSVISYVEERQGVNTAGSSSVDIANASVPMRMFMYAYRPLVFDAGGALGLIVSLENLLLLSISFCFVVGFLKRRSCLTRFQLVFFLFFVLFSWLVLANTTANLGIAIRQKTMFTPMLLLLMISYLPNRLVRQTTRLARKSTSGATEGEYLNRSSDVLIEASNHVDR